MNELHKDFETLGLPPGSNRDMVEKEWQYLTAVYTSQNPPDENARKTLSEKIEAINDAKKRLIDHFEKEHADSGMPETCRCSQPEAEDSSNKSSNAGGRKAVNDAEGTDSEIEEARRRDQERRQRQQKESSSESSDSSAEAENVEVELAEAHDLGRRMDEHERLKPYTIMAVRVGMVLVGLLGFWKITALWYAPVSSESSITQPYPEPYLEHSRTPERSSLNESSLGDLSFLPADRQFSQVDRKNISLLQSYYRQYHRLERTIEIIDMENSQLSAAFQKATSQVARKDLSDTLEQLRLLRENRSRDIELTRVGIKEYESLVRSGPGADYFPPQPTDVKPSDVVSNFGYCKNKYPELFSR